jgi:ethanolamine utilization protein EutN
VIIGKVVGNVWATKKEERLLGFKLLIVRETKATGEKTNNYHIAADLVDAGIDDLVLVVRGSSARQTKETTEKPIDAIIVGVIDRIDIEIPQKNR